jgi:hypothetical protein
LSDLPVSGQITAFAISGKMMNLLLPLRFVEVLGSWFVEMEKQWFAWILVSAIMSWDKLCCCPALRHTITCGVGGVTAHLTGVCCLLWEFGVECDDVVVCGGVCCAIVFATLGGKTVFATLGGAAFSTLLVGGITIFDFCRVAPLKYRPGVSKLTFVRRRPYKMGLLVAGVIVHEWVPLRLEWLNLELKEMVTWISREKNQLFLQCALPWFLWHKPYNTGNVPVQVQYTTHLVHVEPKFASCLGFHVLWFLFLGVPLVLCW